VFRKVIWSLVEIDYLQKHLHDPVNQLCIQLSKSRSAVQNKLKELSGSPRSKKAPIKRPMSKIGRRPDCNNLFFRSGWEANCFRLLSRDPLIKLIEYEPTTFSFTNWGILKGTVSYTPDFRITYIDGSYEWIEIKGGWLKPTDKTKIKRFKKYFPEEFKHLVAVTPGEKSKTAQFFLSEGIPIKWYYPDINQKNRKIIPGWE